MDNDKLEASIEIVYDQWKKKVKIRVEAMPKKDQKQKHWGSGHWHDIDIEQNLKSCKIFELQQLREQK